MTSPAIAGIAARILWLRGHKVMLDRDLAALYGVETRRLNEQVRRNRERFPEDFLIEPTPEEATELMSHFATSKRGGHRKPPLAFTEHGALMAASVRSSPQAVEMSIYVVRACVRALARSARRKPRTGLPHGRTGTTPHLQTCRP